MLPYEIGLTTTTSGTRIPTLRNCVVAFCLFASAVSGETVSPLHPDYIDSCFLSRMPWRVSICKCEPNSRSLGWVVGDTIYKQGSDPCKAAIHNGTIQRDLGGVIAVKPNIGSSIYEGTAKNGVRTHSSVGGPGYTVSLISSVTDLDRIREESANQVGPLAYFPNLIGVWSDGEDDYYFDGSRMIALSSVRGRVGQINTNKEGYLGTFPPGAILFRASEKISKGILGHWLFEDQIWGNVVAEIVIEDEFMNLVKIDQSGRRQGIGQQFSRRTSTPMRLPLPVVPNRYVGDVDYPKANGTSVPTDPLPAQPWLLSDAELERFLEEQRRLFLISFSENLKDVPSHVTDAYLDVYFSMMRYLLRGAVYQGSTNITAQRFLWEPLELLLDPERSTRVVKRMVANRDFAKFGTGIVVSAATDAIVEMIDDAFAQSLGKGSLEYVLARSLLDFAQIGVSYSQAGPIPAIATSVQITGKRAIETVQDFIELRAYYDEVESKLDANLEKQNDIQSQIIAHRRGEITMEPRQLELTELTLEILKESYGQLSSVFDEWGRFQRNAK